MSAALLHTDPTLRVHRAYVAVRTSQRCGSIFLARMHGLYQKACSTELLTDAEDMFLEHVETVLALENSACHSMTSKQPQLRVV